ncbi:MAG: chemotaxis protein CheB [Myxococcaceae bacterium]|nr:chemotaxis protein CheB [Myxococcaceae bacterium]
MNELTAGKRVRAIVIGGSAGAIDALNVIVPLLPEGFSVPLVLALHLPAASPSHVPRLLMNKSALKVKEPDDKEPMVPGHFYVAPPNYHLLLEKGGCFSLSVDNQVHYSRPSIDVLFESAADAFGDHVVGLLLSGANEDGARGLLRIKEAGGLTIVQAPETALVPVMPGAGLRVAGPTHVLSAVDIGALLASCEPVRVAK